MPAEIAADLAASHPADAVERLNAMAPAAAAAALGAMAAGAAVDILDQAGLERPARIVLAMPEAAACPLLAAMSADRRVAIFRALPPAARSRLRSHLAPQAAASLDELLSFAPGTAGAIMTSEFVAVQAGWSVEQCIAHIRSVGRGMETVYAIYVLDADGRLSRVVSLRDLLVAAPAAAVGQAGSGRAPISVAPATPRAVAARLISKYDLLAVPVVNAAGRVKGIVTVDDVIDAMVEENTEDAQKQGGMEALGRPYMQIGFLDMIGKRAGWLSALFLSEMLTASAMQYFEGELEKAVVLTLFIPLIMSSGGNSGSQATSLIIRALALGELKLSDWVRVALRELPSGLVLGSILGVIGFVRILVWQKAGIYDYGPHWPLVALTVSATLVGIVTFGSLAGSMLPFALQKLRFDPASASAPFVATLVDVTGLVIYFSIALLILRGTIL